MNSSVQYDFVHQLQSKDDKGINTAALDLYLQGNGIRQQVTIIYGDNKGNDDNDFLNLFLTRHLPSIADSTFQTMWKMFINNRKSWNPTIGT